MIHVSLGRSLGEITKITIVAITHRDIRKLLA